MYLKRWDVISLPDRVIFANEPHYSIDMNKVRPCLVISLIGNKVILLPFTEKPKLFNFELKIPNSKTISYLKLLSFFQINIRHPEIKKIHKVKIPKEDRKLLSYIWNEIMNINYDQENNKNNMILKRIETKSFHDERSD